MKNKISKFLLAISTLAIILMPAAATANSSVNGPLTFTSITASPFPIVIGKTTITVNGSGFNHINSVYLGPQGDLPPALPQIWDYTKSDTKLSFVVPVGLPVGSYQIQVNTDDNSGRVVLDNNVPWIFAAVAATPEVVTPVLDSISPSSGPTGTTVTITGSGFLSTNTISYNSSFDAAGSISNISSSNGTSASFTIPLTLQSGVHKFALINNNGATSYKTFTVTSTSVGEKHPEGSNVVGPDGTVYRMMGGGRNPYTSAGAFTSYKFNTWATTQPANSFDMSLPVGTYTPNGASAPVPYYIPPRNGALINDKGTVYLITGGLRAGFVSEKVFKDLGYSFSNVYPGDTSFMVSMSPIASSAQKHPNGTLVNDHGTLYVMQNGYRVGFPSLDVLDSWGYWVTDAVTANSYDHAADISGVMSTRMANQMSI